MVSLRCDGETAGFPRLPTCPAALAAQVGSEDRALLVLLADERRTLERVLEAVRQLQGVATTAAGPEEQGRPHV